MPKFGDLKRTQLRGGPVDPDDWIARYRAIWTGKPALRAWYEEQIYARIDARLIPGRTLQIGSGPGFYGMRRAGFVNVDLGCHDGVDVSSDVHALPFAAGAFANVVGIDVLHHFAQPGRALAEIARVVAPGGACLLVEPWAGLVGWFVYRFLHHEFCHSVDAPWTSAFPREKGAMEGNAWLPRALLDTQAVALGRHAPGLTVESMETFGLFAYLATGGFQTWGAPIGFVRLLTSLDAALAQRVLRMVALRAFFILRRTEV